MRKAFPRWLLLAACLTLLLGLLCGCGKKNATSSEIVFWHSYVTYTDPALKKLVKQFNQEHPGMKLKPQYIQTGDGMLQKLSAAISTNTLPDCCWVRTNWIPELAKQGAIFDVYELSDKYGGFTKEDEADFFPSLITTASYGGKLQGLPIQATCMTLGANEKLIRKAGLDPNKPPKDWTEFVDYSRKMTIGKDKIKKDQWGFVIPVFVGQLANYGVWQWDIFLWGWGGQYVAPDGKQVAFNSPAGVAALQYWVDLQRKHNVGTMTAPELAFESQKAAMQLVGCWDIPHLQQLAFKPVLWPMPAGPAKRVFPVDGEYLVVFRKAKHPKEAWEFAKWFTSPKMQAQWSMEAKYLPVRKSTLADPAYQEMLKTDPLLKAFADQMPYATSEPIPFRNGTAVDLLLATGIEEAVRGVKPSKAALDNAAAKANKLLSEAQAKEGTPAK